MRLLTLGRMMRSSVGMNFTLRFLELRAFARLLSSSFDSVPDISDLSSLEAMPTPSWSKLKNLPDGYRWM